jgi:pimeloyl-ACP methyl ester carboxylesterase
VRNEENTTTAIHDVFVHTPGARLFVRIWGNRRARGTLAPIVLIHDLLGSVELWRDFPSQVAIATGHPVVAYDRLGFGAVLFVLGGMAIER